jgi:hypothetical protein
MTTQASPTISSGQYRLSSGMSDRADGGWAW